MTHKLIKTDKGNKGIEFATFKTNNMAQETAVDFLVKKFHDYGTLYYSDITEAKEMEKAQIITAMIYKFNQENTLPYGMEYLLKRDGMLEDFENYYDETYNK
jgi:hypothetical protein